VTDPLYSFDTSAFIKGRRDLLLPDVFPTFWVNIEQSIQVGRMRGSCGSPEDRGRWWQSQSG
jgi:hypothetical protein